MKRTVPGSGHSYGSDLNGVGGIVDDSHVVSRMDFSVLRDSHHHSGRKCDGKAGNKIAAIVAVIVTGVVVMIAVLMGAVSALAFSSSPMLCFVVGFPCAVGESVLFAFFRTVTAGGTGFYNLVAVFGVRRFCRGVGVVGVHIARITAIAFFVPHVIFIAKILIVTYAVKTVIFIFRGTISTGTTNGSLVFGRIVGAF